MQKNGQLLTPVKQHHTLNLSDSFMKEYSPAKQAITPRPKHIQLQLLESPMPTQRDLFAQLISTAPKTLPLSTTLPQPMDSEIEEDLYEDMDFSESMSEPNDDTEEDKEEEVWFKKRQRKSTVQIRMLKQQLQDESSWSKEKIAQLSQTTGLSQSQIYKWWWDQKKKHNKAEREALSRQMKRKIIHKERLKRVPGQSAHVLQDYTFDEELSIATKVKRVTSLEEQVHETDKKVNKRLVF